jgi:hypothetical protein
MVAGRSGDHPVFFLPFGEMGNLVVGTAQFEGKNRLQVFTLEQDAVLQLARQSARLLERGFDGGFIDF